MAAVASVATEDRRRMDSRSTPHSYVVDVTTFPAKEGLDPAEGWINMQVQFLIQEDNAGASELVVGRTVFPPGRSSHERHRHHSAEEFVYVVRGQGVVMNGEDEIEVREGHMAFHPKGVWHGFRNTSDTEEAEVIWAWGGAGSRAAAGYEVKPDDEAPGRKEGG
jgi:quercetin dioxygenase-like cupin family protein